MSSGAGALNKVSEGLQSKFSSTDLTVDGLSALMQKFINDVANGTYKQEGWPESV